MIEISWQPEANTRAPEMIVGFDTVAITLYHRLQNSLGTSSNSSTKNPRLDSSINLLLGNNFLALKAKAALLPWVDGLSYLSSASQDSRLYLPTDIQPNVPIPWIEDALRETSRATLKDSSKDPLGTMFLQDRNVREHQKHDLLYWPKTNTLIQADRYWPVAVAKQNNLLTLWYEQHS